jgi:hypothetical protein
VPFHKTTESLRHQGRLIEGNTNTSVDTILGNVPDGTEPNDVIVTFGSQSDGLPSTELGQPFPNLEHAALVPGAVGYLSQAAPAFGYSDANVMNSRTVNAQILCLLLAAGSSPVCGGPPNIDADFRSAEGLQNPLTTTRVFSAQTNSPTKLPFVANGRVEITGLPDVVKLGEANEIDLRIQGEGLTKVESSQTLYDHEVTISNGSDILVPIRSSFLELPILYHSDGSAYINLVPLRLGRVRLDLTGRFQDGGLIRKSVMLRVGLPSSAPKGLVVGGISDPGKNASIVTAYLSPEGLKASLAVSAIYGSVSENLPIDAKFVKFKVRTVGNEPVIELDESTGYFKPVQVGEALVEITFGGWTNLTCVQVKDRYDPGLTGPPQSCKSLLRPGESLAKPRQVSRTQ